MTMFGGGRDDDADEDWGNVALDPIDNDKIRPALLSWLELLRRNEDPSWINLGGDEEGVSAEDIANIIMEEQTPGESRTMMLTEYEDLGGYSTNYDGLDDFKGSVEEHIMGYGPNQTTDPHNFDAPDNAAINMRSDDPLFRRSDMEIFDSVWDALKGGKFRGYSKNRISGRPERQGKARAWSQSRKVKRGRTRKRYARNKKRGNVRPRFRRQLGAGGERRETKR